MYHLSWIKFMLPPWENIRRLQIHGVLNGFADPKIPLIITHSALKINILTSTDTIDLTITNYCYSTISNIARPFWAVALATVKIVRIAFAWLHHFFMVGSPMCVNSIPPIALKYMSANWADSWTSYRAILFATQTYSFFWHQKPSNQTIININRLRQYR